MTLIDFWEGITGITSLKADVALYKLKYDIIDKQYKHLKEEMIMGKKLTIVEHNLNQPLSEDSAIQTPGESK